MTNLWILTEEKPKVSTIREILGLYSSDFGDGTLPSLTNIAIEPLFIQDVKTRGWRFSFSYTVEGARVGGIEFINIMTVSGASSFLDFLMFKQDHPPFSGSMDSLIMAIEETKTSDDESRNTGVYQRGSKFAFIRGFFGSARPPKLYMLYNDELNAREDKKPSDTSIFGTNILLTLGVEIVGKDVSNWFSPFRSIEDLMRFKANMRRPPEGNVPIDITCHGDVIEVSARLSKPFDAGNIGHDPNIGAVSMIASGLRALGWSRRIVVTKHGVRQDYAVRNQKNKFFFICKILGIELANVAIPPNVELPESYWRYERSSEKVASILLHVAAEFVGVHGIYHNHAGCERSYFKTKDGQLIALPKKDEGGVDNLYLPDLVLYDEKANLVVLVEGKRLDTLNAGVREIEFYGSIEREYINRYYPNADVQRWVSIFGGKRREIPHEKVLLYLNDDGEVYLNENAPSCVKRAFERRG